MSTAKSTPRRATRADLDALPETMRGELIDGVLHAMTRPRAAHQSVAGSIVGVLYAPFQRTRGGPGGWWILPEPGITLPTAEEIAPDVAGWRRTRMPSLPTDAPIELAPDWVCEVLSPSTRRHNLLVKRPLYARLGVTHLWLVDLDARALSVSRLEGGRWVELGIYGDESSARIAPFEDIEINVGEWWEGLPSGG